jgi:hypothetical protein
VRLAVPAYFTWRHLSVTASVSTVLAIKSLARVFLIT